MVSKSMFYWFPQGPDPLDRPRQWFFAATRQHCDLRGDATKIAAPFCGKMMMSDWIFWVPRNTQNVQTPNHEVHEVFWCSRAKGKKFLDQMIKPGQVDPALKFSGLFPAESGDFDNMKTAFERLSLNDAALFYEPENSATRWWFSWAMRLEVSWFPILYIHHGIWGVFHIEGMGLLFVAGFVITDRELSPNDMIVRIGDSISQYGPYHMPIYR